MKNRKGFTLIELLAVIVILGLLMAIAIPSVTKYITQSRKKTVSTTIDNYMGALTNQVNDMEYTFTASNTIYAVPIECISLERGGTNPFGKWHQASNAYWAYVLVQYDDATSSYTYGFTFKDSAGYGLYPTTSEKLSENGSQIQTGLSLTRPTTGTITNITAKANWLGFDVEDNTNLIVLQATSEGVAGNGTTTCTLCQKGDNYAEVEAEKANGGAGGGAVVTPPAEDVRVTFTINGKTYYGEKGMKWSTWVESKYNTDNYYVAPIEAVASGVLHASNGSVVYEFSIGGIEVHATMAISEGDYLYDTNPTVVTFTINGVSYNAINYMTWDAWIKSVYCTDNNFIIESYSLGENPARDYVWYGSGREPLVNRVYQGPSPQVATDIINANATYKIGYEF